MWHASVSLQHRKRGALDAELDVERAAVDALAGVGSDREWWVFSPARIGHLRVGLTAAEAALAPTYCGPIDDAGDSGTERPRTMPPA